MTETPTLESLRDIITGRFPDLAKARFSLLTTGWASLAVEVDGRLIFKFPRNDEAATSLRREADLLGVIRPVVTMPVPDLTLCAGPPLFSRHAKLAGDHLVSAQYDLLPIDTRQRLATDMARFYAELHRLEPGDMEEAGAHAIKPWLQPDEILRRCCQVLSAELQRYARRTVAAWQDLPADPHGTTYGFFDGHGWNMAFDHQAGRLNGIYDFGDSGFGALHQEFIYTNFISRDLTARIVDAYEALTGRRLDRRRIALLSGILRLSELAELADDPGHMPAMREHVATWAAGDASR
ncbi:phosphotransferase family protein [Phreatobacter stygius]|uniref:Aminoglycoside phosphotransferase family protein n=1 Tax=Phreatobacter stygius TaxID=1940610 RepID=A0A4D7B421_9HYPH|nr:aminoglycoside phosphotransferase family protein [Phreatobacter stygius]QCI67661.1 aminoglycoside phosphotransferase family protein [Phreatobacter stygius]